MNFTPFSFYVQKKASSAGIPTGFSLTNAVLAYQVSNPSSYTQGSSTWNDLSGNNNHMNFYNTSTFSAAAAPTYSTDGSGSINTSAVWGKSVSNTSITGTANRSWCGWVKISSLADLEGPFWIGAYAGGQLWEVCSFANTFCLFNNSGLIYGTNTFSLNTWYYLAATYTSSTTSVKLYVNNVDVTPTSGVLNSNIPASPAYIGQSSYGGAFSGLIGMMSLYNTVLTTQQIADNYTNTKTYYGY